MRRTVAKNPAVQRLPGIALLAIGAIFLALVLFAPLLHNHPLDQPEGPTCPAFLIHMSLIPLLILFPLVSIFVLFESLTRPFWLGQEVLVSESFSSINPRSPPVHQA